mmetsp:Transcript_88919/g.254634  ORF Transcript_88919/g.254634 Transcript_88919/m.254634 type:complete len:444 (-) Transcript_88919:644-1975(-)
MRTGCFGHPLHGLGDGPLEVLEFVLFVVAVAVLLWPLGGRRRRASEPPDHVDGRDVRARGLQDLDAPGQPQIALAELHGVVQPQILDKALPARGGHGGHRLGDDLASVEPGVARHVQISGLVRAGQLRDEQIQNEHDGDDQKDGDDKQQRREILQLVEALARKHAQAHLAELEHGLPDADEVRVPLFQSTDGTGEGHDEEGEAGQGESELGQHPGAHKDVGGDLRREDRQVSEQHEVQEHGRGRQQGVGKQQSVAPLAVLRDEPVGVAADAVQERLEDQHQNQHHNQSQTGGVLPKAQVCRHRNAVVPNEVLRSDSFERFENMELDLLAPAEEVNEDSAKDADDEHVLRQGTLVVALGVVQHALRQGEDQEGEQEPSLPEQEVAKRHFVPHHVRHKDHHRVAHELRILVVRGPLDGLRELAVSIHDEVLDVVVHPALPVLRGP